MTAPAADRLYDAVPYPELVYGFAHPGRIAAVATLVGLTPAPTESVRVLELGCAAGLNLVNMAHGLPDGRFVGLDYSQAQIERARQVAAAVGTANVTFVCRDLREDLRDLGEFDLVLAHGLYTWVPLDVRDRVLAVCSALLADGGMALVSYNTYPGWAVLSAFRSMMLYAARGVDDPARRVRLAREQIAFLAEHVPKDGGPYAAYVQGYVESVPQLAFGDAAWADASLLHDELEPFNAPVWFHEFVEHADRHGLEFLSEATFPDLMHSAVDPAVLAAAQQRATSRVDFEQQLDFLTQTMFRRSLLVRSGTPFDQRLRSSRVFGLTVASEVRQLEPDAPGELPSFLLPDQRRFSFPHPLTNAAMQHLAAVSPQ